MRGNRQVPRTPLRVWHAGRGVSWKDLARRSGLAIRTVMLAAAGQAISPDSAAALSRETGIAADVFVRGTPVRSEPSETETLLRPPREPSTAPKRPRGRPPGTHSRSPEVKGRILAEAEFSSDAAAAARWGVAGATVRSWRLALPNDPATAREYRRALSRMEDGFIADAARAFAALARRLAELAPTMAPDEATHAIERVGDVLIQARGLGRAPGDEDDRSGFAQIDRQGAADPADSSSVGSGATH